jgi:hypothetical protein
MRSKECCGVALRNLKVLQEIAEAAEEEGMQIGACKSGNGT